MSTDLFKLDDVHHWTVKLWKSIIIYNIVALILNDLIRNRNSINVNENIKLTFNWTMFSSILLKSSCVKTSCFLFDDDKTSECDIELGLFSVSLRVKKHFI